MAIIDCKECRHSVSDKARSCPNCGAPVAKNTLPRLWLGVAVGAVIVGASLTAAMINKPGFSEEETGIQPNAEKGSSIQMVDEVVKVKSFQLVNEGGFPRVVGELENTSGQTLSYVRVGFSVHDAQGTQIGSITDRVTGLAPHSTWRFRTAGILEAGATEARLFEAKARIY